MSRYGLRDGERLKLSTLPEGQKVSLVDADGNTLSEFRSVPQAGAFVGLAKTQTMRRDLHALRVAVTQGHSQEKVERAFGRCERWFSQLLPVTDRDLLRPGGTTDPQGRRI